MKSVLFLGLNNTRAPMAVGFLEHLAKDPVEVNYSCAKSFKTVHPHAVTVMKEFGVDISANSYLEDPKIDMFSQKIISMGVDVQEFYSDHKVIVWKSVENWNLDNPDGADITFFRDIRDRIKYLVIKLLDEMKIDYIHDEE
ncbi:Arsenate reductase [Candidatus Lokiarchaeum ossiferum]|uniref:Arsenate reductase n=1 Tax=Candidatus Lokiarchaeum ossiferum TaxID=2951803 RepID=A0ABY6HYZ3_9ARCH|nr:Arsenate reductase [Candidatus Lokiarchaeum sp. B-35]